MERDTGNEVPRNRAARSANMERDTGNEVPRNRAARSANMERDTGIGPVPRAWEALILPLN